MGRPRDPEPLRRRDHRQPGNDPVRTGFIIQGANLLHEASVAPSEDTVLVHQARFLTVIAP